MRLTVIHETEAMWDLGSTERVETVGVVDHYQYLLYQVHRVGM